MRVIGLIWDIWTV